MNRKTTTNASGWWLQQSKFGQPIVKDGCGIFGVIRKEGAPEISNLTPVTAISCVYYRGSNLGGGYASFKHGVQRSDAEAPYKIKAFVKDAATAKNVEEGLRHLGNPEKNRLYLPKAAGLRPRLGIWEGELRFSGPERRLELTVDEINSKLLWNGNVSGRIFSVGRYLEVFKEVGYPQDVARLYGLDSDKMKADLWLAHTRQPTNSPGYFPIWSHPFASLDCAIVHNGDISSFGANMEQLSSWGFRSHVGTDSEVIARLLDHLIRIEGLSVSDAATVLTNPYERDLTEDTLRLLIRYRSARLDGPFAVVAGYATTQDLYLIALTDRSKFRPTVIGEDENRYYVASEENEIRAVSKNARVWTPEPGSFFIASVRKGIIETGTSKDPHVQHSALIEGLKLLEGKEDLRRISDRILDATGHGFREINDYIGKARERGWDEIAIQNLSGQRYIGIGVSTRSNGTHKPLKVRLVGFPGNCLANLNDGVSYEVFGNVADDLADTMHAGSVVVHGNARDVAGQTLQGGHLFIRGSVGNRTGIQMREYVNEKPFLIVGETAEDYLGEYMAGGVIIILNLSGSSRPVGTYVGTGMVGGTIYIRGYVPDSHLGIQPQRQDVLSYLRVSQLDGVIAKETYDAIASLEFPNEHALKELLPSSLFQRVQALFFPKKYAKPLIMEHRRLTPNDLSLIEEKLGEFFTSLQLSDSLLTEVLDSEFTVIQSKIEPKKQEKAEEKVLIEE